MELNRRCLRCKDEVSTLNRLADDCGVSNVNEGSEWFIEERIALVCHNDEAEVIDRRINR